MALHKQNSAHSVVQYFAPERKGRRGHLLTGKGWGLALVLMLSGLLSACDGSPAGTAEPVAGIGSPTALVAAATSAPLATAAPAQAIPTDTGTVSGSMVCPVIDGLPIYANAVCIAQDIDQDNGVTKHENTYRTTASADEVRRFFESAFSQNGWTVAESKQQTEDSSWEYTLIQAQRRLKVEVETEQEGGSAATTFHIKELSPLTAATAAPGGQQATITCPAITGLPIYANAACIKHDTDQDDGIIKNQNTYVTSATADDVQRFYAGAFGQNGWTTAESKHDVEENAWSYTLVQAQRRVKLEIEPRQGTTGMVTRITIEEK
jgi:hypothetical protein